MQSFSRLKIIFACLKLVTCFLSNSYCKFSVRNSSGLSTNFNRTYLKVTSVFIYTFNIRTVYYNFQSVFVYSLIIIMQNIVSLRYRPRILSHRFKAWKGAESREPNSFARLSPRGRVKIRLKTSHHWFGSQVLLMSLVEDRQPEQKC